MYLIKIEGKISEVESAEKLWALCQSESFDYEVSSYAVFLDSLRSRKLLKVGNIEVWMNEVGEASDNNH